MGIYEKIRKKAEDYEKETAEKKTIGNGIISEEQVFNGHLIMCRIDGLGRNRGSIAHQTS